MLEKLDLTKKLEKEEYKKKMEVLEARLGELQRTCRAMGLPVMIVFEGYDAAGKGVQIGKLIRALDPRGFEVHVVKAETEEERLHPFLWRFWTKLPGKGRIAIYDGSWYRKVLQDRFEGRTKKGDIPKAFQSIRSFEEQLTEDGMVMIKIFLAIDKKEQKKRFRKLLESKETAWRVSRTDLKRNEKFEQYTGMNEEMLAQTDTDYAPWNIVEASDKRFAAAKIYATVIQALGDKIKEAEDKKAVQEKAGSPQAAESDKTLGESILAKADLSLCYTKEEYKEQLQKLQEKMERLHGELYRKRIPIVLGFEGWDAGGKGGAIRRLTEHMDPRGYVVHPTMAPNDIEKAHHYLWRFWERIPKAGHMAIFDRTWYGRVLVERIEGFAREREWSRAYSEINNMEEQFTNAGYIVLKFWLHIDKEEQERRFRERENTPEKQWKITDEDWRNREKWDLYEDAVNEMMKKTNTSYAPWHVLESNDKKYARIKALRIVIEEIEKVLKS